MKRTFDLDLIPAAGFDSDEYPRCPFTDCHGAVMQYDDCGELVCPDCHTSALTAEAEIHEMLTAAQQVLS